MQIFLFRILLTLWVLLLLPLAQGRPNYPEGLRAALEQKAIDGCGCPGCCPPPAPKCCDPACPKCLGGPPPAPGSFCRWGCPQGKGCPGSCPCDECVCCYTTTLQATETSTCVDTAVTSITVTSTTTLQVFTTTIWTTVESLVFTVYNVFDYTSVRTYSTTISTTLTRFQTELSVITRTSTLYNSVITLLTYSRITAFTGTTLQTVSPTNTILTAKLTIASALPTFQIRSDFTNTATFRSTNSFSSTITSTNILLTATAFYDPPATETTTVSLTMGNTDSYLTKILSYTQTFDVTTPVPILDTVVSVTETDMRYSPTYRITISTVNSPILYTTTTAATLYSTTQPIIVKGADGRPPNE